MLEEHTFFERGNQQLTPPTDFGRSRQEDMSDPIIAGTELVGLLPRGTVASDLRHCVDVLLLRAEIVSLCRSQL